MKTNPSAVRQQMGCGYLPRVESPRSVPQPANGRTLTTCAGYTTRLPEVVEATLARAHWKVGAIVPACGGEMPTEELLNAILVLDGECNAVEGWLMTPSKDGGGGA